jgi:hypothetical protein
VQPSAQIAIEVRPRAGYEAVDLGFRFARVVFRPLFVSHGLLVGALAFALFASLRERPWLMCAVLWWLKPLYDRLALYVLAEALFGRVPSVRETLAALPRLVATGLLHSLTWLRLSPVRSFGAPVLQLEGLRGRARSERVRVLAGRDARAALGLLFACGAFEGVILLAGLQLGASFRPEGETLDFWAAALSAQSPALSWFEVLLYALAISAIEPLYVAGGFALYVNRRVWLEGWDVEQAFRKLARRLAAGALALALALGAAGRRAPTSRSRRPRSAGSGARSAPGTASRPCSRARSSRRSRRSRCGCPRPARPSRASRPRSPGCSSGSGTSARRCSVSGRGSRWRCS